LAFRFFGWRNIAITLIDPTSTSTSTSIPVQLLNNNADSGSAPSTPKKTGQLHAAPPKN
jgi:hypothetical protein